MTLQDLFVRLLQLHPEITTLQLLEFPPVPLVQDRGILGIEEEALVLRAQALKERHALPFWDCALICTFESERVPKGILSAARFHNGPRTSVREIAAAELAGSALVAADARLPADRIVAISSLVRMRDGTRRHIPMLDFHCPVSPANHEVAAEVLRKLEMGSGYLVESGESYHFYGERLLNVSELSRFLGTALLFSPIVDRAWIAHQLIEGFCGLRISGRPEYGVPRVISRTDCD